MSLIMPKPNDIVNRIEPAEGDVLEVVHAVMHAYRSLLFRLLRRGAHPITHMDSKVLGYFAAHPHATQSDLAEHSGRDKAQIARLIKGLREQGLLHAEEDSRDRRNLRLSLTPHGEAMQKDLRRQARRLGDRAVAGLTPAEHAELQRLLQRVKRNLDEAAAN